MSDITLADLDAKSLYNAVMLDPDLVEKLIAENKALKEELKELEHILSREKQAK